MALPFYVSKNLAVCSDHLYLVVIPDIGDDVVDVPLFRLLEHLLHQLLGHALPNVGHGEDDDDDGQDKYDDVYFEDDYGDFEDECGVDLLFRCR